MTNITAEQSFAEIAALSEEASNTRTERRYQDALDALDRLLAHPCAHHQLFDWEVLNDIHELHRQAKQWNDAIEAKRRAIEAGSRSSPNPEADIAECLVEAGRLDEAASLFALLRERDPNDVWPGRSR